MNETVIWRSGEYRVVNEFEYGVCSKYRPAVDVRWWWCSRIAIAARNCNASAAAAEGKNVRTQNC
jgi:hypothetical protein